MKGLNLAGFKKIKEDAKTATMVHKDGHQITIAKGSLPAIQAKQLEKLPIYKDDGGMITGGGVSGGPSFESVQPRGDVPTQPSYQDDLAAQNAALYANPSLAKGSDSTEPEETKDSPAQDAPVQDDDADQTAAPAAADSVSPSAAAIPSGVADGGYGSEMAGVRGKAQAESSMYKEQAALEHQKQMDDQTAQVGWNERQDHMMNDISGALEDVKNGHIDPKHYLDSMSSNQKISSAIGLVLGGWGSAFTGGPNPAQEFLNKQIDRDIDSQKSDQSKKINVYNGYLEKYKNARVAEDMTRATELGIYASKIREAGAKAGSQVALANANIAAGQLEHQQYQFIQQATLNGAINQFHGPGGGGSEGHYQQVLGAAERLNPAAYKDLQSKYLPGIGTTAVPVKPEDSTELASYRDLNNLAKQAQDLAQQKGTSIPFTQHSQQASDLANSMRLQLGNLLGLKRINEYEAHKYENLIRDPGQWNTSQAVQSFKDLQKEIQGKTQALGNRLGIKPFQR